MTECASSLLHYVLQSMADRAADECPPAATGCPPAAAESPPAAADSPPAAADPKVIVDAADGTGLSLADIAAAAANVAREWRRGGVRNGDTVTLFLPNLAEYYVPVLAAWLCGAAVSCTDPDSRALTLARQVKLTGQSP